MPTIVTRGAMSAKAFGFGGGVKDGTFAIFINGPSSNNILKLIFSNCSYATVGSVSSPSYYTAATGTKSTGYFWLGYFSCGGIGSIKKYNFSNNSISNGTCLATLYGNYAGGTGNSTQAIFVRLGHGNTYIYSNDTSAVTTNCLSFGNIYNCSSSNSTTALFTYQGGSATNKYNYSSNTFSSGTSLKRNSLGGTPGGTGGNYANGFFLGPYKTCCGGAPYCVSWCLYNWNNNTISSSSASFTTPACTGQPALDSMAGNSTCLFIINQANVSKKYKYSGNTMVAGPALVSNSYNVGASNGNAGVTF